MELTPLLQQYYPAIIFALFAFLVFKNRLLTKLYGIETVTPAEAYDIYQKKPHQAVFLDVRTTWEFQKDARIKRSKSYPLSDLSSQLDNIKKKFGTEKQLIIICRSASRSRKAALKLKKAGFSAPQVMTSGMIGWQRANYPVQQPKTRQSFS